MDIGKPEREIFVEPIEDPFERPLEVPTTPQRREAPLPDPTPAKDPVPVPEKV